MGTTRKATENIGNLEGVAKTPRLHGGKLFQQNQMLKLTKPAY